MSLQNKSLQCSYCSDRYDSAGAGDTASIGERRESLLDRILCVEFPAVSVPSTLKQNIPLKHTFPVKSMSWRSILRDIVVTSTLVV